MTVPHPYANALSLPFTAGRSWFGRARDLWLRHWLFFMAGSLLVLISRWLLDFLDGGVIIVASYFTDAVIFGLIYYAIREHHATPESPVRLFLSGLKKGRLKQIALCGLWGLPAAAASYMVFLFGPELSKSLVYLIGVNAVGLFAMLPVFLFGGFVAFLASLLPNLAAIQAVRDPEADFRSAGLWAFRGMRSGWRPLAAVFMAFVSASFAAGALVTPAFGNLPAEVYRLNSASLEHLYYWFPWPALFAAMNIFVALLFPMADDLMRAADHDLSDEVFDAGTRSRTSVEFVAGLLDRAGFWLASLAAFGILFWTLSSVFSLAGGYASQWLFTAILIFFWSRTFYRSADAWRAGEGKWQRYRYVWMLVFWAAVGLFFFRPT